jgi:hypothetical protein
LHVSIDEAPGQLVEHRDTDERLPDRRLQLDQRLRRMKKYLGVVIAIAIVRVV